MLEAAREALSFMKDRSRQDLDTDRMLALSVMKSVEIIGEAASKVSEECRCVCPEIPWHNIIGMRNQLIHVYFSIDLDVLWSTVQEDLPTLIQQLEQIVP